MPSFGEVQPKSVPSIVGLQRAGTHGPAATRRSLFSGPDTWGGQTCAINANVARPALLSRDVMGMRTHALDPTRWDVGCGMRVRTTRTLSSDKHLGALYPGFGLVPAYLGR